MGDMDTSRYSHSLELVTSQNVRGDTVEAMHRLISTSVTASLDGFRLTIVQMVLCRDGGCPVEEFHPAEWNGQSTE